MSNRTLSIDDRIYDYLLSVSVKETDVMRRLREETADLEHSEMQISPEQGQFMAMLVKLLGFTLCAMKRIVSMGTLLSKARSL